MTASTVVIKKYGNRRLYDTSASRYVNLEEVAALIRQGADVQVVDAKSGDDLTRLTLTQIIVEDVKGQPTGLPLELLRQLIMASDRARQEFLSWYLHSAFEAYQKVQDAVQTRFSDVSSVAMAPLQRMRTFLAGALGAEPPAGMATASSPDPELAMLRQRVEELETQLGNQEPKRRRPAKRKAATPRSGERT